MAHIFSQQYLPQTIVFTLLTLISLLTNPSFCFKPKKFSTTLVTSVKYNADNSSTENGWSNAGATWYGGSHGDGSEGGACGYEDGVGKAPFSSMVSAVGPSLFNSGKNCGACYKVKCTSNNNKVCSGNPVTVVITDSCPGCTAESVHFDLSGTAFGAMALSGLDDQLRDAGILQIQYQRVKCNYPGQTISFKVDSGANPYYFSTLIEFEDGDGNLGGVDLKQALDSDTWIPMNQSWGAKWKLDSASSLRPPFSLRLKSGDSDSTVVANKVIPTGWAPGQTYRSLVNFPA